jgi:riboflavin kinase/FMN adenylyltransferase
MSARTAISIGNFDGVHRGHAALVSKARELVGPRGRVNVLSFDPNPRTVLRPDSVSFRLTDFEQRTRWLRECGADEVVRLTPTREFLSQSPREFVTGLVKQYSPTHMVEGPDFRFGKGRKGSIDTLRSLGSEFRFDTAVIDPVEGTLSDCSIVRVNSTLIRWLLGHGRVRDAALLLGRPFELDAAVVSGDKRGRTIGVPTANLDHRDFLLPADGIYSGRAIRPDGSEFAAAISVGTKPTFGENPRTCEAHLIGYRGPLDDYGWPIRLQFNDWIRDQLKYDHMDDLVDQLQRDIDQCSQAFAVSASKSPSDAPTRSLAQTT